MEQTIEQVLAESRDEMHARHAKQTFDSLTLALETGDGQGLAWICGYLGAGGTSVECIGAIAQAIKEHQQREHAKLISKAFA